MNIEIKRQGDLRMHYVYIVECRDGTLYTGWTVDLQKRLAQHNLGTGAKYTRSRYPVTLLHWEVFDVKQDALKREYAIKQLPRSKKLALCRPK
jgi:putative endonuclease